MANLEVVIVDRLSGREFDVEVADNKLIAELVQAMREQLNLPEHDGRGPVTFKFVLQRNNLLLAAGQTLREAGVRNQDWLSFWGEPTAAASESKLRAEYRTVLERFGRHSRVKVQPLGDPPTQYRVSYNLRGPVGLNGNTFSFGTTHVALIEIPENYPWDRPTVKMETPACHPNISDTGNVCIGHFYTRESIADVIAKLGNYLQYREYDLRNPWPGPATTYVREKEQNKEPVGPFDEVGFGG